MLSNMLFLFFLSLVPFCTAWVGENHFAPMTVAIYAVLQILCAVGYTFLQITIQKTNVWNDEIKKAIDRSSKKGMVSLLVYIISIPVAFVNPIISEVLFLAVAVLWIVPDKNIERSYKE